MLSHQDSNLNKQNQKLLCYHYTMRQSGTLFQKRDKGMSFISILQLCEKLFCYKQKIILFAALNKQILAV